MSGCELCRDESLRFDTAHFRNVFMEATPNGDLSTLRRLVIQAPVLEEPNARVTYMNDFVYQCETCQAFWLQQYWEVDTPETELEEFGDRYQRVLPLTAEQVATIRRALASGGKLPHDSFT